MGGRAQSCWSLTWTERANPGAVVASVIALDTNRKRQKMDRKVGAALRDSRVHSKADFARRWESARQGTVLLCVLRTTLERQISEACDVSVVFAVVAREGSNERNAHYYTIRHKLHTPNDRAPPRSPLLSASLSLSDHTVPLPQSLSVIVPLPSFPISSIHESPIYLQARTGHNSRQTTYHGAS